MVIGNFDLSEGFKRGFEKPTADFVFNFIEQHVAKKHSSGIYFWMPLGVAFKQSIEKVIRKEQILLGGEEVVANLLSPTSSFEQSNRLELFGKEMFTIDGRDGKKYVLCPTNEEIFTEVLMSGKRSYKHLPKYFFQMGAKYRDEIRPRNTILRTKEFFMKDGYYFCTSEEEMRKFYEEVKESYKRIFNHFMIDFVVVDADSGQMMGDSSEEFIAPSIIKETEVEHSGEKVSGLEIAHIFNLGSKYADACQCFFLDKENMPRSIFSGSYGIGINRVVFKLVENMLTKEN